MSAVGMVSSHELEPPASANLMAGLQAIAEPTRARIAALLGHGEHSVCDVGGAKFLLIAAWAGPAT
jgi:hypothetical protein